jgi:hypothetical protein
LKSRELFERIAGMKELPQSARNRMLLEFSDPQPEVRKNAETAWDWEFADEAAYLYRIANLFKDRFLDPILLTDRRRLPDPVISFDDLRNMNTLAAYTLQRNPQGLLYEITMNSQQYRDEKIDSKANKQWIFGRWAQLETLLHEQVHLWQQNFGADPFRQGRSQHNKEFVDKCESLGLHPKPGVGCHTRLADGPFELLMNELGIKPPDLITKPEVTEIDWFKWFLDSQGKRRKGKSSLHKWTCPECGLNARMGIKDNPLIRHEPCEIKTGHAVFFVQLDGLTHTIYKDKDSN